MNVQLLFASLAVGLLTTAASAATCESLASLQLENTKITTATPLSGTFTSASGVAVQDLPAFCRVAGSIQPSNDSNIQFEVWMPASGWNGKFQGVGNGGYAGSLSYGVMGAPLKHGYAVATTDTGHTGGDASWALGHPEKMIDYGYRGIHEMTVKAKAIITAFYGSGPKRSYFAGCSNGGRQALMEAQRYPGDYDGIMAGAPANDFTHVAAGFFWNELALLKDPASYIPAAKLKAIEKAALAACDAQDGLADGLINDPQSCHFDPSVMLCSGADSESCLTAPQVTALKKIYAGPKNAKGKPEYPGFVPGGETGGGGWTLWINGASPEKGLQLFFATQMYRNMVVEKADWDYKMFDQEEDSKHIQAKLHGVLNATSPDLKAFESHGGKLILYHGWCDAALTPLNTINYYNRVVAALGKKKAGESVRLYMVPGMQHCAGGPGPNRFLATWTDPQHDMELALEKWVEEGVVPGPVIAVRNPDASSPSQVVRTRPLCPYPQLAKYSGVGSIDDAANFSCVAGSPKSRVSRP